MPYSDEQYGVHCDTVANDWVFEGSVKKQSAGDGDIYDYIDMIDNLACDEHIRAELYDYHSGEAMMKIVFEVIGDWKHDHWRFDVLVEEMLDRAGIDYRITQGEVFDDYGGQDFYDGLHYIFILPPIGKSASEKSVWYDIPFGYMPAWSGEIDM